MMSPDEGERLDVKSRTVSAWARINLDRAIHTTTRDLKRQEHDRVRVQQNVRELALQAERASTMQQHLEDEIRADRGRTDSRRLDEMANDRSLRKLRKVA